MSRNTQLQSLQASNKIDKTYSTTQAASVHTYWAQCLIVIFILIFLVDPLELKKASKSAVFYFRDQNIYVDTRKIYCDLTWYAFKEPDETALEKADMTSTLNPASQHLIDSAIVNIGR